MTIKRRKILLIAALLIIAAFAIVLCVGIFTGGPKDEFDGTLVQAILNFQGLL